MLSVAYQGGGAKVFDLVLAVAALQKLERDRTLNVFRVSGASAGAIAAALHAVDADIGLILTNKDKLLKSLETNFGSGHRNFGGMLRLVLNKSYIDEKRLKSVLLTLFECAEIDAKTPIRDLVQGKELRIERADINRHCPVSATETSETPLITALLDSCALPGIFRVADGVHATPYILDGGLFRNFPAQSAMENILPHQRVLGFSFKEEHRPLPDKTKLPTYLMHVVHSLLAERLADNKALLGPANIIELESHHSLLSFDELTTGIAGIDLDAEVAANAEKITRWLERTAYSDGADWFSEHPNDVRLQASELNQDISAFADHAVKGTFNAEEIHHEVIFNSANNKNVPDIYNLHMRLDGTDNPGLQYLRFRFYDSEEGPLKRAAIRVTDADGSDRPALILPIRHDAGERARSLLMCLATPLQPGEVISVKKTEESMQGMMQYSRDGYIFETLGLGPGKYADTLRISVHFPNGEAPEYFRDVGMIHSHEIEHLGKEEGEQLLTTDKGIDTLDNGNVVFSRSARCDKSAGTDSRRYITIVCGKRR